MKRLLKFSDIIILAVCVLPIVLISGATTLYGDDFFYGTYFSDGILTFLQNTREHYLNTNGRALVHFLLQVVLVFRDHLFFAVIPLMLAFIFVMFNKLALNKSEHNTALYYALGFTGVMCIPVSVLREGMLWMSGAFNYVFPVVMSLLGILLVVKSKERTKYYYYPLAIFVGATTEQCGMIAIGSCVLYIIYEAFRKRRINVKMIVLILLMLIGYASLVLSPATTGRIETEVGYDTGLAERLEKLFSMSLSGGALVIFVLAAFLTAKRKLPAALSLGIVCILAVTGQYLAGGILLAVVYLVISTELLVCTDKPFYPILMLAAMGALGMLVLSSSFGYRNILPSLLILITISAGIIYTFINNCKPYKKYGITLACFFVAFAAFFPTLKGYIDNRVIINENIKQLTSGKDVHYNTDIDSTYGYYQFYSDWGLNYYGIRKIYQVPEDAKIFIQGKDFTDFYYNGTQMENPIYETDGIRYYPLRSTIEAAGGTVGLNSQTKSIEVVLGENKVYMNEQEYILDSDAHGGYFRSCIYISEEGLSVLFGLEMQG